MRIISGKYSGRKIITPKGKETRPTTDRFKETLFNKTHLSKIQIFKVAAF